MQFWLFIPTISKGLEKFEFLKKYCFLSVCQIYNIGMHRILKMKTIILYEVLIPGFAVVSVNSDNKLQFIIIIILNFVYFIFICYRFMVILNTYGVKYDRKGFPRFKSHTVVNLNLEFYLSNYLFGGSGPHPVIFSGYSWLFIFKYQWNCLGTIWHTRNWTHVCHIQCKCPIHCTVTSVLNSGF